MDMKRSTLRLCFAICIVLVIFVQSNMSVDKFPAPNTSKNKILAMILAFNFDHIDPLLMIVNEYLSMCEAGWHPTLVLHTTVEWSDKMKRFMNSKAFCYRINGTYPIRYDIHDPSINIALGAEHRKIVGQEIDNFDLFIYQEDDIVVRHSHVAAYLYETRRLDTLLPEDGLRSHLIGFQRYRRLLRGDGHHHQQWGETDILEQELLEETPSFVPYCIHDAPYLRVDGNTHQAMWMLTQHQIYILQAKCSFMNYTSASREHMSSFSLYDRKSGGCGLMKLLPPEGLSRFAVYHYYQQRHVSWIPVFQVDDGIVVGQNGNPHCWEQLVHANIMKRNMTLRS